ncbi:MAG: ABC transporter ATP-binding protein [Devosia sp.]
MSQPLVRLDNIVKQYRQPQQALFAPPARVTAIDDVSIAIEPGQTFGLVGESGCGKSTIGKMLLRLEAPTKGQVTFDGLDLAKVTPEQDLKLRHQIQVVLQDPYASMNPRQRVDKFVDEPQRALGRMSAAERREMVEAKLAEVGISPGSSRLFPHEFSGGQRQRISIARALSVDPRFMVLDEPVSALDVSVRAQVLNLLRDLQDSKGLTYLFIAHDLAIVEFMADVVGVMYLGRLVEIAEKRSLFSRPLHPYTKGMLALAHANETGGRSSGQIVRGEIPSPADKHVGCRFKTRCPVAIAICGVVDPPLTPYGANHRAACHRAEELDGASLSGKPAPASVRDKTHLVMPVNSGGERNALT